MVGSKETHIGLCLIRHSLRAQADEGGCAEGKVSRVTVLVRRTQDHKSGCGGIQGSGSTPHTSLKCLFLLRRDLPFSSRVEPCRLTYTSYSRFLWEFISINCRDPFINSLPLASLCMWAGKSSLCRFQRQASGRAVAFLGLFRTFSF